MLFNSISFYIFLTIFFILYCLIQKYNIKWQNCLIIAASYFFYGWWDYRFLSLIIIVSFGSYFIGKYIHQSSNHSTRKLLLYASILLNLGILGFFKYYNFFIDSFLNIAGVFESQAEYSTLNIILPVGISFYTLQTMSYTIDLYRKEIKPVDNIITFFAFVSFFPKIIAGPLERAKNLLPQFSQKRIFDVVKAKDGLRLILWGMFKKVVIADNMAEHVNLIFKNYESYDSAYLSIGVFLFAIQIYCDFSGYSDMAIGISRLFGFSLKRNFTFPYFSRDIGEFWRRWHISLSSWFRDYVFIPLGGSRSGKSRYTLNILITFVLSGLWYGANWTFIGWGLLHGFYYLIYMAVKIPIHKGAIIASNRLLPSFKETVLMSITGMLVLLAWIFFRADSLSSAINYIRILSSGPYYNSSLYHTQFIFALFLAIIFLLVEWVQRNKLHVLEISSMSKIKRWSIYYIVTLTILLLGNFGTVEFLFFQF